MHERSTRPTPRPARRRRQALVALTAGALVAGITSAAWAANDVLTPDTDLAVNWDSTTLEAAATLTGQARADAVLLASFPTASWLTSGTPAQAQAEARAIVGAAALQGEVPTLVAYNLPFRDCAQYSAGGATTAAEYTAWIDGVAAGIGDDDAVVILEPDGLGIIPWYTTINGELEWCRPAEADPATAAADRFAMLNHAVDALTALPNTAVYLDGTHNGWLGVGDATDRLITAGVTRADGFFLNASNYQETAKLVKYGSWISQCIDLDQNTWFQRAWCGSQYYPASPGDLSTWGLTDATYTKAYADTGRTLDSSVMAHAVIDTSRNGQGPWTPPAGVFPDPEDWCNPPDRGLGVRPTTDTGDPLVDAFLWIKVPGESDGQCFRGTGGPTDPARGMVDPPAGAWFPEQARELIELAVPPVTAPTCNVQAKTQGGPRTFTTQLRISSTAPTTVSGWSLQLALGPNQSIKNAQGVTTSQAGSVVTLTAARPNMALRPGKSVNVTLVGRTQGGTLPSPLLFLLDGAPCSVT